MSFASQFQKVTKARECKAGPKSLKRGPTRPQHEAVETQNAGDARTMGHFPNKPATTKWSWPSVETMGSKRSRAERRRVTQVISSPDDFIASPWC